MSHGSTITIDESKMVAGYTATWVDPKTCATSTTTPGHDVQLHELPRGTNSDGEVDWVLVLAASRARRAGQVDAQALTDSVAITFTQILTDLVGLTDATTVTLTGPITDDTNPITATVRDSGHRTTVRAAGTRLTLRSSARTTVKENP
jgi:hypothetical protein